MEEQNEPKIIRINILQTSMTLGTYLGAYIILAYLVTLLTIKYPAMTLLALPLFLGIPVVAFILVRVSATPPRYPTSRSRYHGLSPY